MITKDELRAHVGHSVGVHLTRSRTTGRLRTASGYMDAIRDDGMSIITRGQRSTERRVGYSEIEYFGCSTDGWHWPDKVDQTNERLAAGRIVVHTLYRFLLDKGPSMSCREINAMAELFRAYGKDAQANAIVMAHASGDDDPEDEHYGAAVDGTFSDAGFQHAEVEA